MNDMRPGRRATAAALLALATAWAPALAVDDCPDAWISTKISSKLVAKLGPDAARINPDTEICVVTLRGCVESQEDRQKAIEVARKVKKVKQVIDQMKACEED